MDLLLALDGGQTGTRALLAGSDGTVLSEGHGAPIRHMFSGGGGEARMAIHGAVREAYASSGLPPGPLVAAACGVTSVQAASPEADLVEGFLREIVSPTRMRVVPDYVTNLLGASDGEPGIVVVAGGGSVAYGQSAEGREALAGGYGYLLGDEGGGYDIGRKAIAAAIKAEDGRGLQTGLTPAICREFGLDRLSEIKRVIYVPQIPRDRVARLVPAVVEVAQEGDVVARSILAAAGADLAALTLAVARRLFRPGENVTVYPTGGVFRSGEFLTVPFRQALTQGWRAAEVRSPRGSPLQGALILARRLAEG